MQQILAKAEYRKLFFSFVSILALLLVLLRYVVLPKLDPGLALNGSGVLASILDKLLSSLLVTVFVGSFVFWFTPRVMAEASMDIIQPGEIGPLLRAAMVFTEVWWFRGGTGRY